MYCNSCNSKFLNFNFNLVKHYKWSEFSKEKKRKKFLKKNEITLVKCSFCNLIQIKKPIDAKKITPTLKLWAAPENSTDVIYYDALTRIQDADTAVNTLEVPFRFYPCLTAGLAYYLAVKRAPDRVQLLKAIYEEEFERAATEDRDRSSFNVVPSFEYYRIG